MRAGLLKAGLLMLLAGPSSATSALPAEFCQGAGTPDLVRACVRDDDGDGDYDWAYYAAGAGFFVVVRAGAGATGQLHDTNHDGIPDSTIHGAAVILVAPVVGCALCQTVWFQVNDPDGDGVPNRLFAHLAAAGDVEHTV